MPVYNAADTLGAALACVLEQTYRDVELIAVDDGSTDDCLRILSQHADEDDRLKVVAAPHAGLVPALQQAIESASGELIGRMDADDLCELNRFEKQIALLDESEADICSCRVALPDGKQPTPGMAHYLDWMNSLLTHEAMARERFIESPLVHPTAIIRREPFEWVGGYQDPDWAEDYDLWLRLFEYGARFVKSPETLFHWRDLETRATRSDGRYSLERFLEAKAHYLARALLVGGRPFRIWGAGKYGKRLAKLLIAEGQIPLDFIDIDPRKVGGHVAQSANPQPGEPLIPVVGFDEIGEPGGPLLLCAVGSRASSEARDQIRATLDQRGFREGVDYWCVA